MNTDELFVDGHKLPQPLTKDELNKLIKEASNGSQEARDKLIIHNIRLVLYEVTNKFQNVDYDKKDLVSIGNIGLVKAINTYDISKGFEFATYAMRCIDNEILMFLRKLKKDQNVDSIDRVVFHDKDGSELKLEDRLSVDSDLVEDHENSETHKIIRELVKQLPDRDKEIVMLHFGFYNDRIYTQREIADKFHISQSYVSRLITRIVNKLGKQLEAVGVIELHTKSKTKVKEKDKKKMRRLQSIYEYFKNYTREQVDEMLSKLTDEERALITLRYGDDLDNPVQSKLTKEDTNKFYGLLVPKMKRLLANPYGEHKKRGRKPKITNSQQDSTENKAIDNQIQAQLNLSSEEFTPIVPVQEIKEEVKGELISKTKPKEEPTPVVKADEASNDITKHDCVKMLELLRTPTFTQMMSVLTAKESIIISLKLGYVDGKYFSTESIAQFLGIEETEVIETTKKVLLLYKENINSFLDSIIEVATDQVEHGRVLSMKPINKK